jgi:RimJ/RimL family protein N-acetyltransferase
MSDGRAKFATGLAIRLEGSLAVLEPLEPRHADDLWRAAQAPEIWRWLAHIGSSREYFDRWFEMSLAAHREEREGVFAIRDRRREEIVGSTRYLAVRPADRALEIGWSWFNPSAWRSGLNVEVKLLMLGHAFDDLDCVRVELKTDARNERSRAAMAAIPAKFEGIHRNHMIVPDVGPRDSAFYSVIEAEWPAVRANLERRLGRAG